MRFHLTMIFVVVFVSMAMHAMASAATPAVAADPAHAQRYEEAVKQAGESLNDQLHACRAQAQDPKASKRDLIACERSAKREFRRDYRQARSDMGAAPAATATPATKP